MKTPFGSEHDNREDPAFAETFQAVKDRFFSRNPALWPCFHDPVFRSIIDFRQRHLVPSERVAAYPHGVPLQRQLQQDARIPDTYSRAGCRQDTMLAFIAALSKDWENPSSVENVITMPCDPAIYGSMIGCLANANLVYKEYSEMAHEMEKCVIRQMATLAGYDPAEATGIFTQGGTFCNLYGYLMGIRKSLPETRKFGMGSVQDYRMINSLGGHYSNITNLSLLGVDIETKTIRIKVSENNDIDLQDLESQMAACFQLKCRIPTIMLTMGTTDTFGVDQVKSVYELRNRLCERYEVPVKPHIHVDSAIGWTMLFFLSYDFGRNPLRINPKTLEGLQDNVRRFHELRYADSFTVDFHKWGYVPYVSSLVMFKHKGDLTCLENDPENFCYFERETQGHTHLQSTIECSRGAVGAFGAYAALQHLAVEGYQITIAHCLQNANYFRQRLGECEHVKVMAIQNQGPSVGFRLYCPGIDAESEYAYEYRIQDQVDYLERVQRNTQWHRTAFLNRGKVGLFTNWVEFIAHTDYDDKGRIRKLPGEKAVFMNPVTTRKEIDTFVDNLCRASP